MMNRWESWLHAFLSLPEPDNAVPGALGLARLVHRAPKSNTGSFLVVCAFLAHVWARWPERVDEWTDAYLELAESADAKARRFYRIVLYTLLALSSAPELHAKLQALQAFDEADESERLAALRLVPIDLTAFDVTESFHLDMLWGAFFGSGDHAHLRRIALTMPWADDEEASVAKRAIGSAACWSVQSNSDQNAHVRAAIRAIFEDDRELGMAYDRGINRHVADFASGALGTPPTTLTCPIHGRDQPVTLVCQHLAADGSYDLGFHCADSAGADAARPDAWCAACEAVWAANDNVWNESIGAALAPQVRCAGCYDTIEQNNRLD